MTNYVYRAGARVAGIDAQTAGEALRSIWEQDGNVTTNAVVDAARPVKAPLHPVFEWDDAVGAEKYRQWQARVLIRSVEIEYPDREPQTYLVSVQNGESYYQDARVAAQHVDERALVVVGFKRRILDLQRGLENFERVVRDQGDTATRRKVTRAMKSLDVAATAIGGI